MRVFKLHPDKVVKLDEKRLTLLVKLLELIDLDIPESQILKVANIRKITKAAYSLPSEVIHRRGVSRIAIRNLWSRTTILKNYIFGEKVCGFQGGNTNTTNSKCCKPSFTAFTDPANYCGVVY